MTEQADDKRTLTPKEAAAALNVSLRTVQRMLYEGSLPGKRLRSRSPWRIPQSEVLRICERLT